MTLCICRCPRYKHEIIPNPKPETSYGIYKIEAFEVRGKCRNCRQCKRFTIKTRHSQICF